MIKNLLLVLLFLGLLFGGIFGWKYYQAQGRAGARSMTPTVVSTQTVQQAEWQPTLPSVGTITPTRGVVISSEVAGVIREIHFDSGQLVEADDLLVQFDAEVDIAEAEALEAESKLAITTRDRLQRVVASNLGSRSDLDEAQAQVDSSRARVAAKQATIRKKTVRAPFGGELGIRRINPGQYLAAGDPIIELVDLDPIYAEFTLPERYLSEISVQQDVIVTVAAWPGLQFPGKISAISPNIATSSRSVQIRAIFDNPERKLHPGMFAEVHTLLPEKSSVLTLPERAVSFNPYGNSVYVVTESEGNKTVNRVQITTGNTTDGKVEILSGLEPGMEVVTDGHHKLRNGQVVNIDNSSMPDGSGIGQ
ncbi:MAG TPA: efflux RND transporter periplasmic adaptor subunit [Xanthomonadales bacterium]|nr:efflux RND transporter periplasmic adaptor subunit [Xanthomonadales bacterium]